MVKDKKNTTSCDKKNNVIVNNERQNIRWLMVFYDTLVYILCWLAVMVVQPSITDPVPMSTCWIYFGIGYASLFGLRFIFRGYKQIWRFGAIQTFL